MGKWVQGFPKQHVHFVNDNTFCYPSGNYVIFIDIETKKKTVLQCINGIVGVVATNIPYEVVAFSDRKLKPLIHIYNFPGLTRRTKLKGILLEDGSFLDETDIIFPQSVPKDPIYGPVLPLSAIAGLVGEEAETFRPKDDVYPFLHPTMHCWTPTSDLYVGCEEGHLLMIHGDTLKATVLNKIEEELPLDGRNLISPVTLVYQKEGVFASGIDGFVYSFIIKDSSYKVEDFLEIERPVEHLMFSPNYRMLLIQTDKGSVYIYTFGEEPTLDKVLDACDGKFLAIDFVTPGTKHFMTLTHSGEVCVWWMEDCACVSKIYLNTPATVLACSPSSFCAAVGTVGGSVHFINIQDLESPQVLGKAFLSESSVQHLVYDQRGIFLLVGTSEGKVFVINAKPSSSFQIIGFTEVGKDILQISTVSLLETDIVEVLVLSPLPETGRSRLEMFTLPMLLPQVSATFSDERGRLRDEFIHKYLYEVDHALSSAVLDFQSNKIYGFCNQVPYICSYPIPEEYLPPFLSKCFSQSLSLHSSRRFGGNLATEIFDYSQRLLTFLISTMEEENDHLSTTSEVSLDLGSETEHTRQKSSIDSSQEELVSTDVIKEIPWIQQKSQEAIKKEVNLFSEKRKEIKRGIKALAKTVLKMMEENETVDNIAKLDQREFGLDLEELERLHDESEEEVAKMRKDAEMHNLAKSYLAELIKKECWKSMVVKGRALKCFHIPYVVENFPMRGRTDEEQKELERVLQQKKIEAECLKLRKEVVEVHSAISLVKKHHEEDDDEEEEEDKIAKQANLPNYLLGSLSTDFGVDTSLLTNQLELHSREEKINQIILLKDIIYKVKTAFNSEFDAAYKQKVFEIARVKERNVRIQEIILDLELEEKVWRPEFEDCEMPERTLVVENEEITARKHVNPWQKAKAELITIREVERRLQSQSTDTRRRALNDMMGGVLEVKKEDILRMVIPQPPFMTKPDALWTEEERKQFKDYEKKVKELNEERDKYRKSLEAELKKLQNSIQESTQNFDEHLKRLFERRVKAEMVVNQEELKINNLVFSLLLDEELSSRELFLNNYLAKQQQEKSQTSEAVRKSREDLDVYREQYDNLLAEDKKEDMSQHRIHKHKTHTETTSIVPFGERPGSGKLNKDNFAQLMKAMDELDNINNMPEGLDPLVWDHFCTTRRAKVENEQKVKQKAAGLMEMVAFLRKRVEEDEKVQQEIEKVFHELILIILFEYQMYFFKTQGQKKVASMMESKEVHKGIFQIEWEHKKMEMEMEDLNQKAWDIQMLFFSRDRQKLFTFATTTSS
ncbi:PREDICTED: cilia- and flagella-associated protein 43 [Propithecus coquereli]|uniref:cilia- and flagella-associated protein 43 n=1 Tax=Propithecus coquereli TaxID=379532 RepID=UPI00063F4E0A|nr:PREDICTED: cilia- and flagella-associated protein 43 [Propithecus coquereli]